MAVVCDFIAHLRSCGWVFLSSAMRVAFGYSCATYIGCCGASWAGSNRQVTTIAEIAAAYDEKTGKEHNSKSKH
jgi:ABC-type nitrate/sulfonate/bicarbonate transport system permease component